MEHNIRIGQKYRHRFINDNLVGLVGSSELPNIFTVVGQPAEGSSVEVVQLGAGPTPTLWGRLTFEENFELIEEPLKRGLADPE